MKDLSSLQGSLVAIVTPFDDEGRVDYNALGRLIAWHLESGTNGIVVCGTTGETPTLADEEYAQVIGFVVERVKGAIPIIAGAGSNATTKTVINCRVAQDSGADGLLVVGPYYNKPTARGYYEHFQAVAQATQLPVIVYNVPGRTGSNIDVGTLLKLANDFPSIIGVKEASGNLAQIMQILAARPKGFKVFSGDDALALAVTTLGGDGCISVVANEIPAEFARMMQLALTGKWSEARKLHYRYLKLMNLNFVESNPIPVKTALALMGKVEEQFRLPMCAMEDKNRVQLKDELRHLQLIGGDQS